jgi:hypothetical protein
LSDVTLTGQLLQYLDLLCDVRCLHDPECKSALATARCSPHPMIEKLPDRAALADAALAKLREGLKPDEYVQQQLVAHTAGPLDPIIAKINELVDAVNELQARAGD